VFIIDQSWRRKNIPVMYYGNITEDCTHVLPECQWSSKLLEINKLYYKYKSNIETILLHPEIPSPIAAVYTTPL